jgi:predicted amidophosphoribosyltransferase
MRWIYPPLCLHCQEETKKLLCASCADLIQLACPQESWSHAAFENQDPPHSILREFQTGRRPELAKAMAGYMVFQLQRQNWPTPDLIVPVPQTLFQFFDRAYHPSLLLAQEIGYMLHLPVKNLLKRKWGGFSQGSLSLEERRKLPSKTFQWKKKNYNMSGKIVLLIDDCIVSGATLSRCKHRLKEGLPAEIYGLAFVKNVY